MKRFVEFITRYPKSVLTVIFLTIGIMAAPVAKITIDPDMLSLIDQQDPDLVRMNAADFVEAELAKPQEPGTTRMLMHSIVWQYVPADQRARVTAAMQAAGARASADAPLAWIMVEADRSVHRHKLAVRYWPGGGEEAMQLTWSHPHGADIEWLAQV